MVASLSSLASVSLTHTESSSELRVRLPSHEILILGHNTGPFLDDETLSAIKRFVERDGTGVVGVHACTSGMSECEWYGELLGAVFNGHPEPQWGKLKVHHPREESRPQKEHFILQGLPAPSSSSVPTSASPCPMSLRTSSTSRTDFPWFDEWYNFRATPRFPPKESTVLVSVDPTTYEGWTGPKGDEVDGPHPLAWCHEVETGGTRVFYTALGHFDDAYADAWFMGMLERAIWWTARRGK
jgi:type 1 glutamine amidotransferase